MNHLFLSSNPKLCHKGLGFSTVLRSLFFSTNTLTKASTSSFSVRNETLYDRIRKSEDRNISIMPVIEEWLQDGRTISPVVLRKSMEWLHKRKRFSHSLEALLFNLWLTCELSCGACGEKELWVVLVSLE
ncbi:unnamed protein product [Dovyalis caffra]|uniref:Uncharacterized protein n=1 Tax=Dovyalis caffra TaxID=77055 RepID=A0AAV1SG93_9ROSI|nr:unnamed protein product [Dovyalis caffra]